jgi:hypothetical protein
VPWPATAVQIHGVDIEFAGSTGDWYSLQPITWVQRRTFAYGRDGSPCAFAVRAIPQGSGSTTVAGVIAIFPAATAGNYKIWYLPDYTDLALGTDVLLGLPDWHEWVVQDVVRTLAERDDDQRETYQIATAKQQEAEARLLASVTPGRLRGGHCGRVGGAAVSKFRGSRTSRPAPWTRNWPSCGRSSHASRPRTVSQTSAGRGSSGRAPATSSAPKLGDVVVLPHPRGAKGREPIVVLAEAVPVEIVADGGTVNNQDRLTLATVGAMSCYSTGTEWWCSAVGGTSGGGGSTPLVYGTPVTVALANSAGVATSVARSDHVHRDRVATGSEDGLLSRIVLVHASSTKLATSFFGTTTTAGPLTWANAAAVPDGSEFEFWYVGGGGGGSAAVGRPSAQTTTGGAGGGGAAGPEILKLKRREIIARLPWTFTPGLGGTGGTGGTAGTTTNVIGTAGGMGQNTTLAGTGATYTAYAGAGGNAYATITTTHLAGGGGGGVLGIGAGSITSNSTNPNTGGIPGASTGNNNGFGGGGSIGGAGTPPADGGSSGRGGGGGGTTTAIATGVAAGGDSVNGGGGGGAGGGCTNTTHLPGKQGGVSFGTTGGTGGAVGGGAGGDGSDATCYGSAGGGGGGGGGNFSGTPTGGVAGKGGFPGGGGGGSGAATVTPGSGTKTVLNGGAGGDGVIVITAYA